MNDQNVTLKLSLVNAMLQYLGTRPYQDVYQLVQELQAVVVPQIQMPAAASADAPAAE